MNYHIHKVYNQEVSPISMAAKMIKQLHAILRPGKGDLRADLRRPGSLDRFDNIVLNRTSRFESLSGRVG
jgi:hypothetical protein